MVSGGLFRAPSSADLKVPWTASRIVPEVWPLAWSAMYWCSIAPWLPSEQAMQKLAPSIPGGACWGSPISPKVMAMKMSMWAASSRTVHGGASLAGLRSVGRAQSSSERTANVASNAVRLSSTASTVSSYERVPVVMVRPLVLSDGAQLRTDEAATRCLTQRSDCDGADIRVLSVPRASTEGSRGREGRDRHAGPVHR